MSVFLKNISLKDKILFYESIANLLDGGVTLLSALHGFVGRLQTGALKEGVENTIYFLESGDSMNVAMRKIPVFYGEKEIAIVESGEQTGMLRSAFAAIAYEMRMEEDLRRKIMSALSYPFIIMIFLLLALSVVMVYVIPQIMPIIAETTTELPFSTRSLLFVSNFLKENIVFIILVLFATGFIFYGFASTELGKRWIDRQRLFLPVIGKVYRNYIIVQIMATMNLLLSSGVSILKTLRLTGMSAGNRIIDEMYRRIADDVMGGQKITESLIQADPHGFIFSPDIIQMIESGEKTSNLAEVTKKISEQYRREVDASLAIMVKFIEPAALLLAGIFVLWFAVAIFSAIMQVVNIAGV